MRNAKQGGKSAVGKLFALYSNYLKILADAQLDRRVRQRVSPSDLVQETLLEAHRDFPKFNGTTEAELVCWLRKILVHNLIHVTEKHISAEKRDVRREISLQRIRASVEQSNSRFEVILAAKLATPSAEAGMHEQLRELADAIAQLPDDQRQVIVLRHLEGMRFADIADQMERTSGACRMLWLRAMDRLRELLEARGMG